MTKHSKRARVVLLVTGILAVVVVGIVAWDELVAWRTFRRDFESLGRNEQGYPEYQHRETGIVFVGLPGGTFLMGSPETESGRQVYEGTVYKVRLSPFLIAKREVSQAEWQKVMGDNPSEKKGDALPVTRVSWEDCQEFGRKSGLSFPTGAQWEYACRAGLSGPFAGTGNLDDMGWYTQNSGSTPHPVGEKQPNDCGLYDMHGNVSEWCADWYQWDYYEESADTNNPLCANSGSGERLVRGGCWDHDAWCCRSAFRYASDPWNRDDFIGFRPAWSSR